MPFISTWPAPCAALVDAARAATVDNAASASSLVILMTISSSASAHYRRYEQCSTHTEPPLRVTVPVRSSCPTSGREQGAPQPGLLACARASAVWPERQPR